MVRVDPEEGRVGEETVVRVGMAGGRSLVEVGGRAECRVGGKERIEGRVTTATSVKCRLPGRSHGNVTVEVSLNGADWGGESVQFRYKGVCAMGSVVPSMGMEEGDTIVTVHGRDFKEGDRVWCRFGEEGGGAVSADVVSDGEVRCACPGRVGIRHVDRSGLVSISVMLGAEAQTGCSGDLLFMWTSAMRVVGLHPRQHMSATTRRRLRYGVR